MVGVVSLWAVAGAGRLAPVIAWGAGWRKNMDKRINKKTPTRLSKAK